MRIFILLISVMILLTSCKTPKENEQQAFESTLSEATLFMITLTNLDSGDLVKTRRMAAVPVFVDLSSLSESEFAVKWHPTPEQKKKVVALAKQALDYIIEHRGDWDTTPSYVEMAVRGLQKILTEPKDVQRLKELSDYCAAAEKKLGTEKR